MLRDNNNNNNNNNNENVYSAVIIVLRAAGVQCTLAEINCGFQTMECSSSKKTQFPGSRFIKRYGVENLVMTGKVWGEGRRVRGCQRLGYIWTV